MSTAPDDPNLLTWQLLAEVNAERSVARLPFLVIDGRLAGVSRRFAAELATRVAQTLSHSRKSGAPFDDQITNALNGAVPCDEIAAEGQPDAGSAVAAWMTSPAHRAAILGPYDVFGGGSAVAPSGVRYWVCDFARLAP